MTQSKMKPVLNGTWYKGKLSLAEKFYSPQDPNFKYLH
jgi:hypothetical protein